MRTSRLITFCVLGGLLVAGGAAVAILRQGILRYGGYHFLCPRDEARLLLDFGFCLGGLAFCLVFAGWSILCRAWEKRRGTKEGGSRV